MRDHLTCDEQQPGREPTIYMYIIVHNVHTWRKNRIMCLPALRKIHSYPAALHTA